MDLYTLFVYIANTKRQHNEANAKTIQSRTLALEGGGGNTFRYLCMSHL